MKATNEITQYNIDNPKYQTKLPEYNCNQIIDEIGKHSTGITVPPPKITIVEEETLRKKF